MPPDEPPRPGLNAYFRIKFIVVGLRARGFERITELDRFFLIGAGGSSVVLLRLAEAALVGKVGQLSV